MDLTLQKVYSDKVVIFKLSVIYNKKNNKLADNIKIFMQTS